jgi:hypothetical protein
MRAEEYRPWALKCLLIARRIDDPQKKARLIDMAATWTLLAHRAETSEPIGQQQQQIQQGQPKKQAT